MVVVNTKTSEGEQNVALSFSLSLRILFATFHASLRAHRSCCQGFLPQICLQISERKDCAHENQFAESHLAMDLSYPNFHVAQCTF